MTAIKKYPSKVLLFGEYTVLFGSPAYALPYDKYYGYWSLQTDSVIDLFQPLLSYIEGVQSLLNGSFDLDSCKKEIASGLRFVSNIPEGQGLGSSGALVAGLYDRFCAHKNVVMEDMLTDLALLENYFHGQSSGLDAMVSFLNSGIQYRPNNIITRQPPTHGRYHIYLLASDISRSTRQLVQWFTAARADHIFEQQLHQLAQLSEEALSRYQWGTSYLTLVKSISTIQYSCMRHLIPPAIRPIWEKVAQQEDMAIKICGAGGGGFYLIFSENVCDPAFFNGLQLELLSSKCNVTLP